MDHIRRHNKLVHTSSTAINNGIIIDVDDNFFTVAFFSIGLFYSLGKAYNRYLLEEVAFEQRRLEARERRLEEDPTLSELDLRREETANWPSVYARKYRGEGETTASEGERDSKWRKSRVSVMDREDDDGDDDDYGMSDDQISEFESTYGVEYDPYYDEPYEESELPVGKYKEDIKPSWPDKHGFESPRIKRYMPNDTDEFRNHVDVNTNKNCVRFLVFFLYLVDNEAGQTVINPIGGDQVISPCKKGSVLCFPPMWTHPHAGLKPVRDPKYIVGSYLHYA